MAHPATCKIVDGKDCKECIWVCNLLSVLVNASSCLDSNLFCANNASYDISSRRLFIVGKWALSLRIAMSLAAIFSIRSMASSRVFNFILPPAETFNSWLDYGLNPSIKMLIWIGLENSWVGVFLNRPRNISKASLRDSSGNWWKEEMVAFPSAVLDSGKYFFRNFSTTSSQVIRLLPLNEWSHLLASPDNENENKLNRIASLGTQANQIVLHISM